jgi:hypothetical protein
MNPVDKLLPCVDLPYEYDLRTYLYYSRDIDKQSYKDLENLIKDFIGSDCWAVTIDDDVIFNSYPSNKKKIRDSIMEEMIRDKMIENPHENFLVYIHRRRQNAKVRIYMFCGHPWTMNIDYKAEHKLFQVSFSQSKEFMELQRDREQKNQLTNLS